MADASSEAGASFSSPGQLAFAHLFDRVRDAVIVSDERGRIHLWNPGATRLFGHSPEEALGQDVSMLVPDRLQRDHERGMERFRRTGSGPLIDGDSVVELPAVAKDGRELVVELTLSRVSDRSGLVMAIVRDVTDRVKLREQIESDRKRLRDANEALESFAYVAGHDLKEPVRAVDVYLESAQEIVKDEEAREHIGKAREANRRMSSLLEGLLEWARAATQEVEPTDLHATLATGACRARYQTLARERGARVEIAPGLPHVLATEGLLCQLFGNLVINAIRHNPRDAPHVRVLLVAEDEDLVCFAVRDDGPGFPPEVRARIGRMRATRPTTVRGGFGMTIALRAAHFLGGRLEVGEAPGGGGEVRVWLPRADKR